VAIARALISKPGLLIADEPTGNLDQALSEEIMELFEKINSQGTTVVIATHNMSLIKKSGRRVLMLEKGELSERKRPSDSAVVKPSMTLQEKELL
jgi:cell division transport system ATP-binding protein